jgi:hypothetical protein
MTSPSIRAATVAPANMIEVNEGTFLVPPPQVCGDLLSGAIASTTEAGEALDHKRATFGNETLNRETSAWRRRDDT